MRLHNIKKTYHNQKNTVTALNGISLNLDTNGIIMILGPSGCGKTTLMNIIAGRTDYEGSITDVPGYDYLTQEFNLFEDMSVMDNLLTVNSNHDLIEEYLKEFSLSEHKNKKVKKLSNGQKKRVQFIRALLHSPSMLLCDEPTAALDHDNTVLLMEEMKKLSDQMQIIIVTHDTALAEQYGDRIITMEKGTVVKDEIISEHRSVKADGDKKTEKKTFISTAVLALKKMIADTGNTVMRIILSSLCILTVFSMFNLYNNVSSQSDYLDTFRNCENMVVSVPKQTTTARGETLSGYKKKYTGLTLNDLFGYDEVWTVIENHPEIIAVEYFNSYQYSSDTDEYSDLLWARREYDLQAYENTSNSSGWTEGLYPNDSPVLMPASIGNQEQWQPYVTVYQELTSEYRVQVFDLVNGYDELPLICGEMDDSGAVLSRNTADLLMEADGYASYESLIGETITLGVDLYHDSDAMTYLTPVTFTVSAVSSIENDNINMVFMNGGFTDNPVFDAFVEDREYMKMDYVRFLLEPGCDYETIAQEINDEFHKTNTELTVYQGQGLGKDTPFYQSPAGLAVYGIAILVILTGMTILLEVLRKRKLKKEKTIMKVYGYSPVVECVIRNVIICAVSFVLSVICTVPLSSFINEFAASHYYQPFMSVNAGMTLAVAGLTCIFMILLETIAGGRIKHA